MSPDFMDRKYVPGDMMREGVRTATRSKRAPNAAPQQVGEKMRSMRRIKRAGIIATITLIAFSLSGCAFSVGEGSAYGYIEAVGSEWGTTTVYVKSTLESSKSDLYCADDRLKNTLNDYAAQGIRVKLTYKSTVCWGVGADRDDVEVEGRITAVSPA